MQNKGALKFLAIVLTLACVYQLSFTFVSKNIERKASEYAAGNPDLEQFYLDSMKNEVVYNLGITEFTYNDVKNREINLGLDLKGGMNVMLEISEAEILKALSGNNQDPAFNQALAEARAAQVAGADDFISEFSKSYEKLSNGGSLVSIFGTMDLREVVQNNMTNAQVIAVLRGQVDDAIANSFNVIRNRIDRFGVTQPNIQRLENTGRILVELPGIKEPERVRKLLQGSASLEFWSTYKNAEIFGYLQQANQRLTEVLGGSDTVDVAQADSVMTEAQIQKLYPLFSVLAPMQDQTTGSLYGGAVIGVSQVADTAKVNSYLAMPQVKSIFPRDVKFMWSVKPGVYEMYELYAIKANTKNGVAPLDGSAVADARADYSQTGGAASEVTMIMNAVGAKTWARMTADNINNCIAIVLDGFVYSAPNVNGEITGGRSSITGNFTYNEANDLAIVLKSGKLPAPARIVQEAIVGPTLGQESIETGVMSFILAFALVLLYMIAYYNTAGFVANIALIANLFFLFGVLASFGAVLTLPGIAGIVLTMGMAVDANVIIYERIKEEVRAGKGLSLSIADGFKNAYSAIIDGNATTLITGIVLFMFGTGPVQGFATTLIIGIITSLFCAIFITRLVFLAMVKRKVNVKFSNKVTENFLTKSKIDFIGARNKTYIVSSVLILITIISLFARGLSLGVDFSGGRAYVVRFDKTVTTDEVREALNTSFEGGLEVKQFGNDNQ
ncbi:MAG: protein translocase subunit SecD, partial [Rikenellaceae bacterium]